MFTNYIKVAIRNLKKYKGYSFINILGLSVGMACTILILLWVQDELSYDRFLPDSDRLYRVIDSEKYP
ncbi:ABC transporter permease, partial [bacterium BMS3Abin03]|nr:ABC transporter permease [bacterium BMS3Abin03]